VEVPLRALFQTPTIAALAEHVEKAILAQSDHIELDEMLDLLESINEDEAVRLLNDSK
jgi:hypothetical protein